MSPEKALLFLLSVTNFDLITSQTAETVLKIGVILDNDIDEEPLRQTVDKLTEHYRPWLPQSRISTVWRSLNSSGSVHARKTVCNLLKTGIKVLVTVLRCPQLKSVVIMTEQFKIPHLSVNLEPCPVSNLSQFTIHLSTQDLNKHKVLADIAIFVGWKKIALVFGKSLEKRRRQDLVLELSKNGLESVLNSLFPMSTWSKRHEKLAVFTTSANLPKVMSLAAELKMLGPEYWWIFFPTDVTVNNDIFTPYNSSNVLLVKAKPQNIEDMSLFSGLPCIQPDESLRLVEFKVFEALALYRFATANTAFLCETSAECSVDQSVTSSALLMEELRRVCGSTEDRPENCCILKEYDLYSTQVNSDTLIHVGEWTLRNKLTSRNDKLFLNNFTDFGNSTIRIALPSSNTPFSAWDETRKTHKGLLIDMVEDLAKILKFNYIFTNPADGVYGNRLSNGSWTGLIGMVERREVEFAAAVLTITPERSKVVDFTTPFMQDSLGILTPKPKEVADLFQIFKPFSVSVWLTFVAFVIVAFITLIIISIKTYPLTDKEKTVRSFVKENVFLIISSSFEQGPTFHPTSISARCLLTFWFVFTLLMMAMYTAHLAAVLTVSTPLKPINSLQDLVDQPDMKVLVSFGSNTWSLFSESDNPLYQQVGKRMEKYQHSLDPIRDGGYSFVADRAYLEYWAVTNCQDMRLADERFQGFSLAFAVPKNSSYKESLNLSIQKMVESGVMVSLTRKWLTPSGNCSGQTTASNALVLSLDRVGGIFIVYNGLLVVAGVFLLAERTLRKYFPWNTCK